METQAIDITDRVRDAVKAEQKGNLLLILKEVREFLDRTHPNRTSSMVADGVVYVTLPGIMPKHLTYRQADIVPTATNAIESARR